MDTEYIPERVRNAAINLDHIMDDMAPFNDVVPHEPNAGKFALAVWLEQIVDDRRNAIAAHAEHLRATFESMAVTLKNIADTFENVDGENAKNIKKTLGDMQGRIEGEWREWDSETEKAQGNYSGDNGKPGDGWSTNLNNRDPY